jgi:hypothetical protein
MLGISRLVLMKISSLDIHIFSHSSCNPVVFRFVAPVLWVSARREVKRFWWRFSLDCKQPGVSLLDVLVGLVPKYDNVIPIVGD